MEKNGEPYAATVIKKSKVRSESGSTADNEITLVFEDKAGKIHKEATSSYVSVEEYDALVIGDNIPVLYNPSNGQTYYTVSFNRFKSDQWFLYAFPAFLFLVGAILGLALRKYKVGIHKGTGLEYVEKDGQIVLDEGRNATAAHLKHLNIFSKFFQAFR